MKSKVMTVRREADLTDEHHTWYSQMRKTGTYTDFVINVDGEQIAAHRLILTAASPYFRAMLSHDTKESLMREVAIEVLNAKVVTNLVDYFYTGVLDVPCDCIEDYIKGAR